MVHRPWHVALVFVAVLGLNGACVSHKVVRRGEVNEAALKRVERRTSEARGLPFKTDVGVEAYTRAQSAEWIAQRYSGDETERSRAQDVVAHRLGILPDGVSLSALFRRTLTQNAAGVYRPREKTLFLVTDLLPGPMRIPLEALGVLTGTDWNQELVLSHELTHALQDQHFDLDNHVLPGGLWGTNEDMGLARKSIVESEANIVSQAYLLNVPLDRPASRNLLISYLALFNDLNVLLTEWTTPGLPPFYAKLFVEQYSQGMRFVQAATNRGGWGTLGEAYRGGLPRSTEQMMSPAKYFGHGDTGRGRDEPVPLVALPDTLPAPLQDYVVLEDNVFGALLWRVYFDDYMRRGDAIAAATGWGGDRYAVLEERLPGDPLRQEETLNAPDDDATASTQSLQDATPAPPSDVSMTIGPKVGEDGVTPVKRARRSTLVWRTQWDTSNDANEFFLAYASVLLGKYPGRAVVVEQSDHAFIIDVGPSEGAEPEAGVRTHTFERAAVFVDGMRAVVLEGVDPAKFAAVKAFAWKHNRVDEDALVARGRGEGFYAAPLPPGLNSPDLDFSRGVQMPLAERALLPHHRAVFRLGAGVRFDEQTVAFGRPQSRLLVDRELRWGFRQHLEWAPPFVLSLDVTGAALGANADSTTGRHAQTIVTAGLLDATLGLVARRDLALVFAPVFAVTQRVGIEGVSLVVQGRAVGDFVTHGEVTQRATVDAAAALYLAPFAFASNGALLFGDDPERLVLSFGAGLTYGFDDVGAMARGVGKGPTPRTVVLGAATTRGMVSQPTVELRLLDAVFLYEMSKIFLDPTTFQIATHEHVGGILIRF